MESQIHPGRLPSKMTTAGYQVYKLHCIIHSWMLAVQMQSVAISSCDGHNLHRYILCIIIFSEIGCSSYIIQWEGLDVGGGRGRGGYSSVSRTLACFKKFTKHSLKLFRFVQIYGTSDYD